METILKTLQEEFWAALARTHQHVRRDQDFPEAKNLIKVAIGMRRSGKTGLLFQKIRDFLEQGVSRDQILYLNFEDDRILPMDHRKMGELIDAWYTLYPENHHRLCYLFLDEVQNIEEWALVLRRINDTKLAQLYVTGSSAKLLSSEIATSLRGRSLSVEVLPYSYKEYLRAHGHLSPTKNFGKRGFDEQRQYFLDFMQRGGFPGVQSLSKTEHQEVLQDYIQTVILRDIVERHNVTNITLLKYTIQFLLKNFSTAFSINKFFNTLKSQGYSIARDTLYQYLAHIEDAYLIFSVPIFSESLRHVQTAPKKIFSIDPGLTRANTLSFSNNLGRAFENLYYLDLRRQGKKICYYKTAEGYEIDFVTQDSEGRYELIQIVWDTEDDETLERETRALKQAEQELGFSGKLVDLKAYLTDFAQ